MRSLRLGMIAVCGIGMPSGWRNSAVIANQSARPPTMAASAVARTKPSHGNRRSSASVTTNSTVAPTSSPVGAPLHAVELDLLVGIFLVNRHPRNRRHRRRLAVAGGTTTGGLVGLGRRAKLGYRHAVKAGRAAEWVEGQRPRSAPRPLRGSPFTTQDAGHGKA